VLDLLVEQAAGGSLLHAPKRSIAVQFVKITKPEVVNWFFELPM
jgi:hypothetical protein